MQGLTDITYPVPERHQGHDPVFVGSAAIGQNRPVALDGGQDALHRAATRPARTTVAGYASDIAPDVDEIVARMTPWPLIFLQTAHVERGIPSSGKAVARGNRDTARPRLQQLLEHRPAGGSEVTVSEIADGEVPIFAPGPRRLGREDANQHDERSSKPAIHVRLPQIDRRMA